MSASASGGASLLPDCGRFVVLEHDHPFVHWDLMLEANGVLKTWRLPAPPAPGDCDAEALGDHRIAYLDYEGPVSGNRGRVVPRDRGTFTVEAAGPDRVTVLLSGERGVLRMCLAKVEETKWRVTCGIKAPG